MKEFNPKEVSLKSETALALIRAQQHPVIQYGLYVDFRCTQGDGSGLHCG